MESRDTYDILNSVLCWIISFFNTYVPAGQYYAVGGLVIFRFIQMLYDLTTRHRKHAEGFLRFRFNFQTQH